MSPGSNRRRSGAPSKNKNTRRIARNVVQTSQRREHGYIPKERSTDPVSYNESICVQYKRRVLLTGLESEVSYTVKLVDLIPDSLSNDGYKVQKVKLYGPPIVPTATNGVTLSWRKNETGQQSDVMQTSDRGTVVKRAACSLCPPQDDWMQRGSDIYIIVSSTETGSCLLDIWLLGRISLPEAELDVATLRSEPRVREIICPSSIRNEQDPISNPQPSSTP